MQHSRHDLDPLALGDPGQPAGSRANGSADEYAAVCAQLWAERELLETLLFRLTEEQLVLRAGATRWLPRSDDEVRTALLALQDSEVMRAVEVELLTRQLTVSQDSTLRELVELAPEPWGELLADHCDALRALTLEIQGVAAENRRLLHIGAEATRETLDRVGTTISTYDARGEAVDRRRGAYLLDQQA